MGPNFGLAQPSPSWIFLLTFGAYQQGSVFQGCPRMLTITLIHVHYATIATDHFFAPVRVSDPLAPPLWEWHRPDTTRQLQ
jgi:hypothetical protein